MFGLPFIRDKGDYTAVAAGIMDKACFLGYIAEITFFGNFFILKFAAYTDPFSSIEAILLFCTVAHQIFTVLFDVTHCVDYRKCSYAQNWVFSQQRNKLPFLLRCKGYKRTLNCVGHFIVKKEDE